MLALYFFKPQILLSRWRSWPVCKLQGLSSAECSDDLGENWIEIRPPPAAVIQVPFYGYRLNTDPIMRLIVDRHLNYWMEALSQCIRSGTLHSLSSGGLDLSVAQGIIDLLAGGAIICQGRLPSASVIHQNDVFTISDCCYHQMSWNLSHNL